MGRTDSLLIVFVSWVLTLVFAPIAARAEQACLLPPTASATQAQTTLADAGNDGASIETPGQNLYNQSYDPSALDPASWAVTAYKSQHRLDVYYKGRFFRSYPAVFSRSVFGPDHDDGAKLYSGDLRTPEGLYVISKEYPSARFRWFLRLNYPNRIDRIRYEELRERGSVPVADGRLPALGSAIGIHGTDQPILNRANIDWTIGCVSVDNEAIEELHRLLPIGTIVLIKP